MTTTTPRRAAIYARISVTQEESVSVARQIESAEQYAAAHGWQVVGTFVDDGVSASHNKPDVRDGWRALLESKDQFDVVIVWKVDRLSRRLTDFWDTYKTLAGQGRSLVSVTEGLDMTTAIGRTIAGLLAGFAEVEAETISARVTAARNHLLKAGRVVGGTIPYGWVSVPNPDGPGFVLAQDPDRVRYVREAAERVLRGDTLYSVVQWMNESGVPLPKTSQKNRKTSEWSYTTLDSMLRNPLLAGMTAHNPGNKTKERGTEVLRDENGLPVVDESVAILSVADWRKLQKKITDRDSPQSRPRAMKSQTSPLLSGLVWCGEHDEPVRMHRGTSGNATKGLREGYSCPDCHQTITSFEPVVLEEFLRQKGERVRWSVIEEVHEGGAALLPEIAHRLDELDELIRQSRDRDERARLRAEQDRLYDLRDEKEREAPAVVLRETRGTQTFGEDWDEADTAEERRAILDDAMKRITVRRGGVGRQTSAKILARLAFDWKVPEDLGPIVAPDDATLASWAT